ncbi:MAG: M48 family metalloprotease [Selenomonadaceae bacterium]|nr:M48 family metalloprotease [Selenomonadaceae bacterium]
MKKFLVAFTIFLTVSTPALAADSWGLAAEALGLYAAYRSALSSMLALGENVAAQVDTMRMDFKENGRDTNPADNKIVDDIMNKLINNGDYALRANSLPFLWGVNNSRLFNASCYPTNYVSINKGLLRALEKDEAALAAVFAHEMIHGLMQHSANSYAEAVVGSMGAVLAGMHSERISWERLNGSVGYGIAKNVILPAEIEADEKGFYLMTSAGFHPGGGAMAMARMRHYMLYETKNIFEFDGGDKKNNTVSDHPETQDREKKLAAMMTEYSVNHVTVQDSEKVFIDGKLIYTAKNTAIGYDNRPEVAYGIAGGLSKAFHDYKTFEEWNFTASDYLTKDSAYKTLKTYIKPADIAAIIKESYQTEDFAARIALKEKEEKRRQENAKILRAAIDANAKNADKYRYRSDTYSDYLMSDLAFKEIARAKAAKNNSDLAETVVMEGRAYAAKGDYINATAFATRGIAMDGKNEYNYLNRADIYYMQGKIDAAIADTLAAIKANEKNALSHKILGNLYEAKGDMTNAKEAFKKAYSLNKEIDIPFYILKEIDEKAYKERLKTRQNAEKRLAEEYNEKHKKERGK